MTFAIYMFPGACSRVTMTAMEELGLEYETRVVNLLSAAQKSAAYLDLNRKGKVPALLVDDRMMTENAALLYFLHRSHPGGALLPGECGSAEEQQGLSDSIWCSSTLHPMVRQIRNPQRFSKGETQGVKADGMEKFAAECAYISQRVANAAWWYGDRWSIVDTYLYWAYSTAAKGDFPIPDYPELVAHAARVRARPAFQRTLAREIAIVEQENLPIPIADL